MHVANGNQLGDVWSDIASAVQSGAQIVQTFRPPSPVGTSPLVLPTYAPPVQQAPRSFLSDPMTLALIAMGGLAVVILLMRR